VNAQIDIVARVGSRKITADAKESDIRATFVDKISINKHLEVSLLISSFRNEVIESAENINQPFYKSF